MNVIMIDVETANTIEDPIVYDVGYEVFNLEGKTLENASLVNSDIFLDKNFMDTAYYAEKVPDYWRQIWAKERQVKNWKEIKWQLYGACQRYDCKIAVAHNARFDSRALNLTQRYITTSQYRWVLPYNVDWWCTLKMAREVLKNDKTYQNFCTFMGYTTQNGKPRYTAEILYRYISGELDFEEKHTGLEDVRIEKEIFLYCMNKMPDIDGRLWPPKLEPPKKLEPWEIELQELLA